MSRKTHCPVGHTLTYENRMYTKEGWIYCVICKRIKATAYYHRTKKLAGRYEYTRKQMAK